MPSVSTNRRNLHPRNLLRQLIWILIVSGVSCAITDGGTSGINGDHDVIAEKFRSDSVEQSRKIDEETSYVELPEEDSLNLDQGIYPNVVNAYVVHDNSRRRLPLEKNYELLGRHYTEIIKGDSIRSRKSNSTPDDFCYYHGIIEGDRTTHAAMNLCRGKYSGTILLDHRRYELKQSQEKNGRFVLLTNDSTLDKIYTCGYNGSNDELSMKYRIKRSTLPNYYSQYVNWKELYVELAIVFDQSMFHKYGQSDETLFERAKQLANLVNSYYQPVNIKVALVYVEVWTTNDAITVNASGDTTLNQFLQYRRSHIVIPHPNDHAQLITNAVFTGGVVGKAMKSTMCSSELSGAVVMDHDRLGSPIPVAATMAHEMGHNFGMEHDDDKCECPQARCLMAASSSGAADLHWSSCSLEYLSWGLQHGGDFCLRNKPDRLYDSKDPVCGNGFVEEGEECDCGLPQVCENKCCNATYCTFNEGAICASGDCCDTDNCQFKALATECRSSRDECDLAEYCNGKSEICPNDVYKHNGISCKNDAGYCYNGTCGTHEDQCKFVWGPTGQAASVECYQLNSRGDVQGNCGFDRSDGSYKACLPENLPCGLLHCFHKTERTSFGDRSVVRLANTVLQYATRVVSCHSAMIDIGSDKLDPGLVPGGSKCGKNRMCVDQTCVDVAGIVSTGSCSSNCNGHGVCNNLGHCHCDIGYGGAECGDSGLGGSPDSGPASNGTSSFNVGMGILIFLLVVLPVITAVLTILHRKGLLRAPKFKLISVLLKPNDPSARSRAQKPRQMPNPPAPKRPAAVVSNTARPVTNNNTMKMANNAIPSTSDWPINVSPPPPAAADKAIDNGYTNKWSKKDDIATNKSDAPPGRPKRPKIEVLEKLYVNAGENTMAKETSSSLLNEVISALGPEYESHIVPQRRAPPPPDSETPDLDDENDVKQEPDSANEKPSEMQTSTTSVAEKAKMFQDKVGVQSPNTLKRPAKTQPPVVEGPTLKSATGKRPSLVISEPVNPKIGREPVDQSAKLQVVSSLQTQTLPKNKNDTVQRTPTSTSKEPPSFKKPVDATKNVKRSVSAVSASGRPTAAPPPPPAKPSHLSNIHSRIAKSKESTSAYPLVLHENFDSDHSERSLSPRNADDRSTGNQSENYYDIIPSPSDERKEEDVYANIDDFRVIKKENPKAETSVGLVSALAAKFEAERSAKPC